GLRDRAPLRDRDRPARARARARAAQSGDGLGPRGPGRRTRWRRRGETSSARRRTKADRSMAPTVLFLSPGYPAEMPLFARGLSQVGARVFGVGDQPTSALPNEARAALSDYLQVANLWDEQAVVGAVRGWLRGRTVDRVECLWEPGVVLAARLREALGAPGMDVETATRFRDKELMKQALDAAGVRTPR